MLHGRVVRPRGQGAYGDGTAPAIVSVDESSIKHIPGARVVRKGDFLGVVAPKEYDAIQAAAQLKVKWADPPALSGSGNLWKQMRDFDSAGQAPARIAAQHRATSTPRSRRRRRRCPQTYALPLQRARADRPELRGRRRDAGRRADLSQHAERSTRVRTQAGERCSGLPLNKIRVHVLRGLELVRQLAGAVRRRAGGGADVAARRRAGAAPVHALGRARLGQLRPGELMDIRGGVDANGKIVAYRLHGLRSPAALRQTLDRRRGSWSGVAARRRRRWRRGDDGQSRARSTTIPNRRVIGEVAAAAQQLLQDVVAARAAGSADGVRARADDRRARLRGEDGPVEFRAQEHRPRPTQDRVASTCSMRRRKGSRTGSRKVAASNLSNANVVTGRGIAPRRRYARLAGSRGRRHRGEQEDRQDRRQRTSTRRRTPASPSTRPASRTRSIGSLVMGASRALLEQSSSTRRSVTSLDWVTYPILRFKDSPKVTTDRSCSARTRLPHRLRRAAARSGPRGDRQRVLRRHRRPHPRGADDAGPRPRRSEGGGPVAG